jgi:tRNA nucleotidyltransferase (CCA-adding enzyme)
VDFFFCFEADGKIPKAIWVDEEKEKDFFLVFNEDHSEKEINQRII